MIDPDQLTRLIIRPSLKLMGMHSRAAEQLLLGTACAESACGKYLHQVGGPALGIYQMEPFTHDDIWGTYIKYRLDLGISMRHIISPEDLGKPGMPPKSALLVHDLRYATIMARLKYRRSPMPLPVAGDWEGMAAMWKAVYNSAAGKGTVEHFMATVWTYGAIAH